MLRVRAQCKVALYLCVESAGASAESELRPALDALLAAAAPAPANTPLSCAEGGTASDEGPTSGEEGRDPSAASAGVVLVRPRVLWGVFYRQCLDPESPSAADSAALCAAPQRGPSCLDLAVARARATWGELFPGEAFLPSPSEGTAAAAAAPEDEEERDAEILRRALEAVATATTAAEAVASAVTSASMVGVGKPSTSLPSDEESDDPKQQQHAGTAAGKDGGEERQLKS